MSRLQRDGIVQMTECDRQLTPPFGYAECHEVAGGRTWIPLQPSLYRRGGKFREIRLPLQFLPHRLRLVTERLLRLAYAIKNVQPLAAQRFSFVCRKSGQERPARLRFLDGLAGIRDVAGIYERDNPVHVLTDRFARRGLDQRIRRTLPEIGGFQEPASGWQVLTEGLVLSG